MTNEEKLKNVGKNKHCSQAYFTMGCPGIRGEDLDKTTKIGNSCDQLMPSMEMMMMPCLKNVIR